VKHEVWDSETPLSNAKYLNLMDKGLYFLPLNIFMLSNLEKLLLLNNLFTEFPKGIDKLEHLRVLGLGKNKLTSVPASIGRLENLNFLSLEENQLVSIPKEIVNLQKLVLLDLTRNKITKLPDLIDANSHYRIDLLIAHNPLTELPISLKNMERCRIFIGENPLDSLREWVEGWNNVTFCDSRNDLPFD
jgi:Leucine-rich repeat (LRR) protein